MNGLGRLLLIGSICSAAAFGQPMDGFEQILLPAFSIDPIPGQGALFSTTFAIFSERSVRYYPDTGPNATPMVSSVPSLTPFLSFYAIPRESRGRVIYIGRESIDHIAFDNTLSISGSGGGLVVPLPVVREREFRVGTSRIAGLRVTGSERVHLRLYDLDGSGSMRMRVRVRALFPSTGLVIDDQVVDVNKKAGLDMSYPYYREVSIIACPQLPCQASSIVVEVEPLQDGRYYPFVTVTNNQTQLVTTHVPP